MIVNRIKIETTAEKTKENPPKNPKKECVC